MELIVLIILAFVAYLLWEYYSTNKRRNELAAWARSQGLQFEASRDYDLDKRFSAFECLKQGDNQYAYNRMHGTWQGYRILGFDFHYQTYSYSKNERQTHHHYFSAVILQSPVPLKPLFIRPEGFLDRVAEFLGFDDIDFESIEFSRRFYVKAPDRRWAYDVIHQRTMEFLLASPPFTLQFDRASVIAYRDRIFSLAEFEAAAEVARGILERLPEYVKQQQLSTT